MAIKKKWVKGDKVNVTRIAEQLDDTDGDFLKKINANAPLEDFDKKTVDAIKKRKWISIDSIKFYSITKGAQFSTERKKLESDLTFEMLKSGAWKNAQFKGYNFEAIG